MEVVAKQMISIRLDPDLIELLAKVSEKEGSYFYDRDRTWLIEEAIREKYQPLVESNGGSKETS